MFNWLNRLFFGENPMQKHVREQYEFNKENNEVWHYTCINKHKWQDYNSPCAESSAKLYNIKPTKCPVCKSTIASGIVYINGKKTTMGAVHIDFKK